MGAPQGVESLVYEANFCMMPTGVQTPT